LVLGYVLCRQDRQGVMLKLASEIGVIGCSIARKEISAMSNPVPKAKVARKPAVKTTHERAVAAASEREKHSRLRSMIRQLRDESEALSISATQLLKRIS
jgi:hypothetical protein